MRKIFDVPKRQITDVMKKLSALYPSHPLHVSPDDCFHLLVAVVLSSRTKDPVTNEAMARLWKKADSPAALLKVPEDELAETIKPVGFYKNKARQLHRLCSLLLEKYGGKVPKTREELMELPGVGRKVANLVLNICFDYPAICVDTHVHRISNRLGWIESDTPEESEAALEELVDKKHWCDLNRVLVNHGQQVCKPVSPMCNSCEISRWCKRKGVLNHR